MSTITCIRCQRQQPPMHQPPYPGALGAEILEKVCGTCWMEWQQAEVMVINELRLDFMDPKSQDILVHHLREFLCLDGEPPPAP